MPFDTTYHYINSEKNITGTIIIPGEKDTIIYLQSGQYQSDIDRMLQVVDSIITVNDQPQRFESEAVTPENHYTPDTGFIVIFISIFIYIIYSAWKKSEEPDTYSRRIFTSDDQPKPKAYLRYFGDELNLSDQQVSKILLQRFPYYQALSFSSQNVFIERLQQFMADKTFKIHGEKGYKEMPVLISAAAIQLTFGLNKFLLPHFQYIHIHPEEFLRVRPILCFLEGNVSGHSINLSWKHFLAGYENPNDGQNVGLHELAHALHYQTFIVERNQDKGFRDFFDNFTIDGNKAFHTEKTVAGGLYSEYAEKNFQEFWAESVEIFFEKPAEMLVHYPKLYETMKHLLNQDPYRHLPSINR